MALSKKKSKVPGALFIFDTWDKNKYGLPAFHRYLVKTLGKKKGKSLRLYSTVLSDKIGESHKRDAEKLGVTLLMAERRKRIIPQDDPARLTWLHNFESYYPEFQTLNDIQYIIGYAPKTGDAAADIRDGAFPSAQLVLINHASPENDCALVHRETLGEFEQRMLKMATEADLIFSMGPKHYGFFQNQYRVTIGKKDLQAIPHEEILPVPSRSIFKTKVKLEESDAINQVILTYGTFDDDNLLQGLEGLASAVGSTARIKHETYSCLPDWDIHGVNKDFQEAVCKLLHAKLSGELVSPRLFRDLTMDNLTTKLCQSHVCLPIPFYGEYSFDGLEALALGVPLLIEEYSHLASFIKKYLPHYEKHCVVRRREEYPQMIQHILKKRGTSFDIAGAQKRAFKESKEVSKSYKRFAAMLAKDIDSNDNESDTLSLQSKNYAATGEEIRSKSRALMPGEQESLNEKHSQNSQKEDRKSIVNTSHESESEDHYPRVSNSATGSSIHMRTIGSDEIIVKIKLNEDDFNKEIRMLDGQTQQTYIETLHGKERNSEDERQALEEQKRTIQTTLEQINKAYKERVYTILKREENKQFLEFLSKHCNNNHAILIEIGEGCLALLLKFRFLQNLSKFRGSCLTGKFTKPLEQFLVTKEMREAAKKSNIDLQLASVYDIDLFHKIEDFFIERDGGSDVTEESTSSEDDDVDTDQLEAPIMVNYLQEAPSFKTSDQLRVQGDLAEAEERLHTNPRLSSMEISILQRERDDAIQERCSIQNQYRQLLTETEKKSEQLIKTNTKLKECEKKNEILESELNRDKRYTGKSQERHLEPDDKNNSRPKSETKQLEIHPQKLKQEIEEQLQTVQRGKTLQEGISLRQDNEISLQRNQLRVSTATTGGTNTVSGELTRERGLRLSNAGDTDVYGNERLTQQLVSPLHRLKEQSRNLEADGKVTDLASMGEDLDIDCPSKIYSTPSPTAYYTNKKRMLTASQKGKRLGTPTHFRKRRDKEEKGNESAVEASATRKDRGLLGISSISSPRPTATSPTWSVQILGTWSSTIQPGNFNSPRGIIWHRTRLVVCDRENHRVQILDEHNQYEGEIRFDSKFPSRFQPWDVAISDDKYYITDIGNNQIIICYQNCEIIEVIHLTAKVYGITIMAGFVWVTDCQEYAIFKYTLDGKFVAKAKLKGHDRVGAIAQYPYSIVSTDSNRLLVSDELNNIIQVLDSDMNYMDSYCTEGSRDGEVRLPRGIDLDSRGNIYICDWRNHRIVKLRENGELICNLFEGEIESPNHIAVNGNGDRIAITVGRSASVSENQIFLFSK